MKKYWFLVLFFLSLFASGFAQWQKAKLPANNAILSLAVEYATSYVYAGSAGNGVYLSADTGATWSTANTGLPANLNVWNILIRNKNIFLATDDGVYKSANNGSTWEQAGLKGVLVKSFTCYPRDTVFLYAGTEKGIYLSKNNGMSWSLFALPDTGISALLSTGTANFYAGITSGGLNYSTDYGKNWLPADNSIAAKTTVKSITYVNGPLPGLGITLGSINGAVGTDNGVYVEKNTGNWVRANNGLGSDTLVNSIISNIDLYNFGYIPLTQCNLVGTGRDIGNVYQLNIFAKSYIWSSLSTGIDGNVNALARYLNIVFAGGTSLWILKSDIKYLYITGYSAVPAAEGDTTTFKVISNGFWFIQNYYDWLNFSPNTGTGDTTITITVASNNTNSMRAGTVTMNGDGNGGGMLWFYQDAVNTTGIANAVNTNITIHPVPVKDEMVISFPNQAGNTRFAIYNLSGAQLLVSQLTGNTTNVNLSGFKPGVYVLKIYSQNNCITRKIIKQ